MFTAELTDVAALRWMTNAIENTVMQVYITKKGNPSVTRAAIVEILFRAHDEVARLVTAEDSASGCPPGWEGDGGYCFPCKSSGQTVRLGRPPMPGAPGAPTR